MQVVLTDTTLPDGDWRGILDYLLQRKASAELVVCARIADARLWCDVLERGAYDVLVEPYQSDEVRRIVEGAAARSYMRSLAPAKERNRRTEREVA